MRSTFIKHQFTFTGIFWKAISLYFSLLIQLKTTIIAAGWNQGVAKIEFLSDLVISLVQTGQEVRSFVFTLLVANYWALFDIGRNFGDCKTAEPFIVNDDWERNAQLYFIAIETLQHILK